MRSSLLNFLYDHMRSIFYNPIFSIILIILIFRFLINIYWCDCQHGVPDSPDAPWCLAIQIFFSAFINKIIIKEAKFISWMYIAGILIYQFNPFGIYIEQVAHYVHLTLWLILILWVPLILHEIFNRPNISLAQKLPPTTPLPIYLLFICTGTIINRFKYTLRFATCTAGLAARAHLIYFCFKDLTWTLLFEHCPLHTAISLGLSLSAIQLFIPTAAFYIIIFGLIAFACKNPNSTNSLDWSIIIHALNCYLSDAILQPV